MMDIERYTGHDQVIYTVIEHIWEEFDDDKSGALDFEETKVFMQEGLVNLGLNKNYKVDEEMLKNIFKTYDEDNSGTIDKEEMFFLIKSMMDGIKGSEEVKIYTKPKLRDLK